MSNREISFSEDGGDWQPLPAWIEYMISFGYSWNRGCDAGRRIALLSMPCASPAAGLVALGAMIRDLERPGADDMATHSDSLFDFARQYIDHCRKCDLTACNPAYKGCGCESKSTGIVRSSRGGNHVYAVSEKTDFKGRKLSLTSRRSPAAERAISDSFEKYLYIDGSPPLVLAAGGAELDAASYQGFLAGVSILPENLKRTYSGLVLAGRAKGDRDTRSAYEAMMFGDDAESNTLAELLTVPGWAASKLSRVAFFNARTGETDRLATFPRLVVADGDASFLKTVETFKKADIVGVIDRSSDRERLEAVGERLASLTTWYEPDVELLKDLPSPPPGISVATFRKQ